MKLIALLLALSFASHALASGEDFDLDPRQQLIDSQKKLLCHSTQEYIETLDFLRKTRVVVFPEKTSRMIAEKVSRGCDGAAERFSKVLVLLKTIGVSEEKALTMALDFTSQTPEVQKNFVVIFSRSFLSEFFDYDYGLASRLAFELSKDYKGDPKQAREDFVALSRFCKDKKNLDMPTNVCAEIAVKFARLSQYYPKGIRAPFQELYGDLRNNSAFGLDMKAALDLTYNVLKNGPRAPENFFSGFKYAAGKDGLSLDKEGAIAFALKMAERSFIGDEPPVIPPVDDTPRATHAVMP